jgi:hypothetical protein
MTQRGVEEDGVACGRPKHTNHCVCGEKGEKRVFESQCCGKGTVKNQNTKTTPFPKYPFLPKYQNHGLLDEKNT